MNGAHDLGGMHGFGPIGADPLEPVFHKAWERRIFALTLACGFLGKWNIDMSRFAREQMPPAEYLSTGYYEHWLFGLERLLVDKALVSSRELAEGLPQSQAPAGTAIGPEAALEVIGKGGDYRVDEPVAAGLAQGSHVRCRNIHPRGHTRLPRYARGRSGIVQRDYGVFTFPDANAEGGGPAAQHLYNVRFTARELWGSQASDHDSVNLDLWESYLEPV